MKQDYTLYVYKTDRRTKSGERLVSTTEWTDQTESTMRYVGNELYKMFPASKGFRFEYQTKMITVKNLMTGSNVEIDRDTPWCCNPASETYWSM
jgi:hypothetical protein